MEEFESLSDEELYDHILDEIETALDINTDSLEVDVEDGFVSIWGSLSNIRDSEELEKLLFETLGLEDVDFDVVIDEGIQTPEEAMDDEVRGRDVDLGPGGEGGLDDIAGPRRQI